MNTNRSNLINNRFACLLVLSLAAILSTSCLAPKAQQSAEQNAQSSQTKPRRSQIECKEKSETLEQSPEWKGGELQSAVIGRDIKSVKRLLRQNADVNEKDNYGRTSLLSAVTPIIREPELTPPGTAQSPRQLEARRLRARQDDQRQLEIIRELLMRRANPNLSDIYGATPLTNAAGFGYQAAHAVKLLTLLIEHQADINAQDERGLTALMGAARNNNPDAVKLLLKHRADPNLISCDGQTAGLIAESRNFSVIVRLLHTTAVQK